MTSRAFAAFAALLTATPLPVFADLIPGTTLQPSVWFDASTLELADGDCRRCVGGYQRKRERRHAGKPPAAPLLPYQLAAAASPWSGSIRSCSPEVLATQFMAFPNPLANTEDGVLSLYLVSFDSGTRSTATSRATVVNTRDNAGTQRGFLFGYSTEGTLLADYAHISKTQNGGGNANLQFTSFGEQGLNLFSLTRSGFNSTVQTFSDIDTFSTTVDWTGFVPSALVDDADRHRGWISLLLWGHRGDHRLRGDGAHERAAPAGGAVPWRQVQDRRSGAGAFVAPPRMRGRRGPAVAPSPAVMLAHSGHLLALPGNEASGSAHLARPNSGWTASAECVKENFPPSQFANLRSPFRRPSSLRRRPVCGSGAAR